jgi:hypothetical protein
MTRQATEEAATPVKRIVDEMLTPDSTSVRSWVSPAFLVLCFQYCGSSSVIYLSNASYDYILPSITCLCHQKAASFSMSNMSTSLVRMLHLCAAVW